MNIETGTSMLKGALETQAQAASAIIAGGAQVASPQGSAAQSPADAASRSAGLAAEGKGQNIDTTA